MVHFLSCWRNRLLLAVVAVALAVAAWAYLQARQAQALADPEKARQLGQAIPVRTAQVTEREVEQVIGATCLTMPSQTGAVRIGLSQMQLMVSETRVRKTRVHEGDFVKAGDVLYELEDRETAELVKGRQASLAAGQALLDRVREQVKYNQRLRQLELESSKAEIEYRKADLKGREEEFQAYRKLYETKAASAFAYFGALSLYVQAQYSLEEAKHRLEKAQDALKVGALLDKEEEARALDTAEQKRVDLAVARHHLERLQVRAPVTGFVHYPNLVEIVDGDVLDPNGVLVEVQRLDPIYVRVDFPQERAGDVALGQKTEVVVDSLPKETFAGTVVRIAPEVNSQLRVLPVIVAVDNPDNRIKSGVSGFVRFRLTRNTRTVPTTAVIQRSNKTLVFCVQGNRAHLRKVRTGFEVEPGTVEVRAGLQSGEEVVIFNQYYLQDNDVVDLNWKEWARRR